MPHAVGLKESRIHPVATHPAYRRLELARALILVGRLRGRGMDTALLGTSSENTAMLALAHVLGFHAVSNTPWYSKKIA
jgi:ribosomal protein S18 acetylase RimI-like enzyme